jgi:hypothetical protein
MSGTTDYTYGSLEITPSWWPSPSIPRGVRLGSMNSAFSLFDSRRRGVMTLTVVGGTLESIPCLQLCPVFEKLGIFRVGLESIQNLLACTFLERSSLVLVKEKHAALGDCRPLDSVYLQAIPLIILTMRGARRISPTPYSLVFTSSSSKYGLSARTEAKNSWIDWSSPELNCASLTQGGIVLLSN